MGKLRHLLIFLLIIILKEPNMTEADSSLAGFVLIGTILVTICYKKRTRHPPLGPDPNVVGSNTNTTVSSGHNRRYENVDSYYDQAEQGQGQSQAITASTTSTTATVMTSGHDQTGQGQSQATAESLDAHNLSYVYNSIYDNLKYNLPPKKTLRVFLGGIFTSSFFPSMHNRIAILERRVSRTCAMPPERPRNGQGTDKERPRNGLGTAKERRGLGTAKERPRNGQGTAEEQYRNGLGTAKERPRNGLGTI
ncbi:hypothetical protein Bbelb_165130 [Branchiostoma belcheri]|nr:hypothetical protein Bbelb_165130 [Branchiostoma belcheri]